VEGVYFLHFALLAPHVPGTFLAAEAQAMAQPGEPFASLHWVHLTAALSQHFFDPFTCPHPLQRPGQDDALLQPFPFRSEHFDAHALAHFPSSSPMHLQASFFTAQPLLTGHVAAGLLHLAF